MSAQETMCMCDYSTNRKPLYTEEPKHTIFLAFAGRVAGMVLQHHDGRVAAMVLQGDTIQGQPLHKKKNTRKDAQERPFRQLVDGG